MKRDKAHTDTQFFYLICSSPPFLLLRLDGCEKVELRCTHNVRDDKDDMKGIRGPTFLLSKSASPQVGPRFIPYAFKTDNRPEDEKEENVTA